MEEAENTKSVRNAYTDDVLILFDKIVKIIHWIDRSAKHITTAVNPYNDRLRLSILVPRCPDIQIQAVFTLIEKRSVFVNIQHLIGTFRIVICLVHAIIRFNVHRCLPTVFPNGLLADKRDPLVCDNAIHFLSDESAIDTLNRELLIILAIGDLFVLTILSSQLLFFLLQNHLLLCAHRSYRQI